VLLPPGALQEFPPPLPPLLPLLLLLRGGLLLELQLVPNLPMLISMASTLPRWNVRHTRMWTLLSEYVGLLPLSSPATKVVRSEEPFFRTITSLSLSARVPMLCFGPNRCCTRGEKGESKHTTIAPSSVQFLSYSPVWLCCTACNNFPLEPVHIRWIGVHSRRQRQPQKHGRVSRVG